MRERIEKILQDKEMTQAEFADLIGVNRSSITHLMTGRNKSSDTVAARTLLAFPDINPNWLSYGDGDMYLDYPYATPVQKSLFEDKEPLEDEKTITNFDRFNSENRMPIENPIVKNNSEESYIQPPSMEDMVREPSEAISAITEKKPLVASDEKKIKKIVFFYTDKTFEEYYPE